MLHFMDDIIALIGEIEQELTEILEKTEFSTLSSGYNVRINKNKTKVPVVSRDGSRVNMTIQ